MVKKAISVKVHLVEAGISPAFVKLPISSFFCDETEQLTILLIIVMECPAGHTAFSNQCNLAWHKISVYVIFVHFSIFERIVATSLFAI